MLDKITKTVYSTCYPETKQVLDELLDKKDEIHSMYSEAFTKKQDAYHHSFLNAFKNWSKPVLNVDWANFKFSYPTNGSSEAIREQLAHLKSVGKENLYVFHGEYEKLDTAIFSVDYSPLDNDILAISEITSALRSQSCSIEFESQSLTYLEYISSKILKLNQLYDKDSALADYSGLKFKSYLVFPDLI